jgi:hypothetical protein
MNEAELRSALKRKVLARFANDPNTRILDELGLRHGAARIDIAVVNGILHGFELKSDKDTLKRLPHQIQIYSSVLDKVTLVVGCRHAKDAERMLPQWWGIKVAVVGARGGLDFVDVRRAGKNPVQDAVAVCRLLWRDEAFSLLDELGHAKSLRHKPRTLIYSHLAEVADLELIRQRVRHQLKFRIDWRSDSQLA